MRKVIIPAVVALIALHQAARDAQESSKRGDIEIRNEHGSLFLGEGEEGFPLFKMTGKDGQVVEIGIDAGSAFFRGILGDGKPFCQIAVKEDTSEFGLGDNYTKDEKRYRAAAYAGKQKSIIAVRGKGNEQVLLGFEERAGSSVGPALIVQDPNGKPKVYLGTKVTGCGSLRLWGKEGNRLASIEEDDDGKSSHLHLFYGNGSPAFGVQVFDDKVKQGIYDKKGHLGYMFEYLRGDAPRIYLRTSGKEDVILGEPKKD
ncbi:MAG: hypothetical protein R3F30_15420 [Planctomycetota bacterium]